LSLPSKWRIVVRYGSLSKPKLEVRTWGLLVTLPQGLSEEEAYKLLERHKEWIERRHSELVEAVELSKKIKLAKRSTRELRELAQKLLEEATRQVLGMNPCRLVLRKMKSRWASCSAKGTLTLNKAAKYLPEDLVAYIIYHEVCHIIEPKHNAKFWKCISQKYPNYREMERLLLAYEIKLGLRRDLLISPSSS